MNLWLNIKYYFKYFDIIRGQDSIKNYFSSNETFKAIKELTEEGYNEFYSKFCDIAESYSNLYPMNSAEISFIENVKNKCISNLIAKHKEKFLIWDSKVSATFDYVSLFSENKEKLNDQFQLKILQCENKLLKKNLEQIWPISEAVILRRLCKKLLEKLIKKNINIIDIDNYIPDIKILKNYLKSLSVNYFPDKVGKDKNFDIEKDLKKLIAELEKSEKESHKKETKKKNPSIKFLNENNEDIKIIKIMLKMKTECNHLIHFNKNFTDNIDIIKHICDNFNIKKREENSIEMEEELDELNEEHQKNQANKIEDKSISISKVAEFIAYGNPSILTLKKLETFSNEMTKKTKEINKIINNLKQNVDDFNERKNLMLKIKSHIDKELSNLVIKNFDLSLNDLEIEAFANYFNKNIYNINDIQANEIAINNEPIEINYINYFNDLRRRMCIKDRLKLNITFDANMQMINITKKLDIIIDKLEKIKQLIEKINVINNYYIIEMKKLIVEINNIKISINFIKRENIFIDINQESFIITLQKDFENEKVDYFNNEVNNFFLFIYLLKNNLYDEKSYKSAVINDDYM